MRDCQLSSTADCIVSTVLTAVRAWRFYSACYKLVNKLSITMPTLHIEYINFALRLVSCYIEIAWWATFVCVAEWSQYSWSDMWVTFCSVIVAVQNFNHVNSIQLFDLSLIGMFLMNIYQDIYCLWRPFESNLRCYDGNMILCEDCLIDCFKNPLSGPSIKSLSAWSILHNKWFHHR